MSILILPRQQTKWYGWRPDKPDHRDVHHEFHPRVEAPPPPSGSLPAQAMPPVGDQGQLGSCTGWSTSRAVMYLAKHQGKQPAPDLSAMFAYYNGRVIEGTVREDAGCEIRDVVKAIAKLGVAPERRYPYNIRRFTRKPGPVAYREAQAFDLALYQRITAVGGARILAVKQALASGSPVVSGFSVYENFEDDETANTGLMRMPAGEVIGGHATWYWAWDDNKVSDGQTGCLRTRNSWGVWGDHGDFWMPYAYAGDDNLADDFWVLRATV